MHNQYIKYVPRALKVWEFVFSCMWLLIFFYCFKSERFAFKKQKRLLPMLYQCTSLSAKHFWCNLIETSCKWNLRKHFTKTDEDGFYLTGISPGKGNVWSDWCVYRGRSALSEAQLYSYLYIITHGLYSMTPHLKIPSFMPKVGLKRGVVWKNLRLENRVLESNKPTLRIF